MRTTTSTWGTRVGYMACLFLLPAVGRVAGQRLLDGPDDAGWERLEACRLVDHPANDGDSFHVRHQGREYIFRLYFVDAPETGDHYPDRVKAQAGYFGVRRKRSLEIGHEAAAYTAHRLKGREFVVITRWQNARGNDDLPRFYAGVFIEGEQLAELLVAEGLARRYGAQASFPGGVAAAVFRHRLMALEEKAKAAGRGGWSADD